MNNKILLKRGGAGYAITEKWPQAPGPSPDASACLSEIETYLEIEM